MIDVCPLFHARQLRSCGAASHTVECLDVATRQKPDLIRGYLSFADMKVLGVGAAAIFLISSRLRNGCHFESLNNL